MADFIGDFVSAACDIAHELKVAVGTGFTILGSRLKARECARVECGPQWLTEFEEQRDSLEPGTFPARDESAIAPYLEFTSLKPALTCLLAVVDIAATESLSSIVLERRLN